MPGARADSESRRRQILDAALHVAARRGLDQLTVRQVAAQAGLSSGLVFFHFHSKDELLLGLLDDLLAWLVAGQAGGRATRPPTTFRELICSEVAANRADKERTETLLQFWVLGLQNPSMRRRIRAAVRAYQDLFLQAARQVLAVRSKGRAEISPASLAGLGMAIVLGSEVASLLDPKWFDEWDPTAPLDALLRGS